MCGRFTSTTPLDALAEAFAVEEVRTEALPPRWNIAPTQPVLAVATRSSGARALGSFRWGLVPPWAKDPSVGSRMINARAEGIADRPAYRRPLLRRRCVIPADAFYEWRPVEGDGGAGRGRGRGRSKLPYAIRRTDGAPMALAGLWEVWHDPALPEDAPPLRSAVIITTSANELLAPIHDRMPVVLDRDGWERWLDPARCDRAELEALLVPAPPAWFEAFPVGTRVNHVDQDDPDLLTPLPPAPANSA